jgi:CrcB protein
VKFQLALLAGLGGFAGSVLRYAISTFISFDTARFAWATFTVNMLGCLLMGLLSFWVQGENMRIFLLVGILGGFTTFSGLGFEIYRYLVAGETGKAITYVISSVVVGTILVWIGRKFAEIWV